MKRSITTDKFNSKIFWNMRILYLLHPAIRRCIFRQFCFHLVSEISTLSFTCHISFGSRAQKRLQLHHMFFRMPGRCLPQQSMNSDIPPGNFEMLSRLNKLDLCRLFLTEWWPDLVVQWIITSPHYVEHLEYLKQWGHSSGSAATGSKAV